MPQSISRPERTRLSFRSRDPFEFLVDMLLLARSCCAVNEAKAEREHLGPAAHGMRARNSIVNARPMCLPTALGCYCRKSETSVGRRFLGSSRASQPLAVRSIWGVGSQRAMGLRKQPAAELVSCASCQAGRDT